MLPREIETERGLEQTRFDLPTRDIGRLRFFGLVPILFAVGFAWMPAHEIVRMASRNIAGKGSVFEWVFVAFLSIFVIVAMMPFGIGLFILMGRTRVVVTKDKLIMTELAGPIRWSRKIELEQVERLEIGGATKVDAQTPRFLTTVSGIAVVLKDGKKMPVAIGYPRPLLQPLVAEISSLMQRHGKSVPIEEAKLESETESQTIATEQRAEKPTGSPIELSATGWSAEFKVPARGLFRGSYGLVFFGLFACAILSLISATFISGKGWHALWQPVIVFFSIFWVLGIGILLLGVHLGTRRWTLRADHAQLQVTLKSALRSREWRWGAGEIGDICVGDSGTKVNERTLEQLQIHPRSGGRKTGLLTDRTHDELAWIATTLRGILRGQIGESPEAPPRIDHSRKAS